MITRMSSPSCRSIRALLRGKNVVSFWSVVSDAWKVSVSTIPLKRLVLARDLGVGHFDVDGGDVVGQQHDLVGVQVGGVLVEQVLPVYEAALQSRVMKVPVPTKGSRT